jgi:circadian clock protein KaiC
VILLDHRIQQQVSTRRIRIVKYRGSAHGTNEYPFLIDSNGISVLPVTSLGLHHKVSSERVSTGVARLDSMLGGGYYRGSSVLVSGTAGSGKSSLAAHFVHAACQRGERCLYLSFEESREQIVRNMRSISLDLEPFLKRDLLRLETSRPTAHGLEMHLAQIHQWVTEYKPRSIVIDPISSLVGAGSLVDTHAMLLRLIDFLKSAGITALFLSLTGGATELEATKLTVSSLIDTWIVLRDIELAGERNRGLYVIKSRGMNHSNQIREFLITSEGIRLRDVYVGPEGVLTGSMRSAQEAREKAAVLARREEVQRKGRELDARRAALEAQVVALQQELKSVDEEARISAREAEAAEDTLRTERTAAATRRGGDTLGG